MSKFLSFRKEYVSYVAVLLFGLLLSALAVNAATTISSAVLTAGGTITVPAAYSLDTAAAGVLNIGTSTATTVVIGSATAKVGIASSSPVTALGVTGTTTSSLGMKIGALGSGLSQVLAGSCALTVPAGAAGPQVASTTAPYSCAVANVLPGDIVIAQFATSTGSSNIGGAGAGAAGWTIIGSAASTTAGFITVVVRNDTGSTLSLSQTGIASSTSYLITR